MLTHYWTEPEFDGVGALGAETDAPSVTSWAPGVRKPIPRHTAAQILAANPGLAATNPELVDQAHREMTLSTAPSSNPIPGIPLTTIELVLAGGGLLAAYYLWK